MRPKYRALWIKDGIVLGTGTWFTHRKDARWEGIQYPHFAYVEDEQGNIWGDN